MSSPLPPCEEKCFTGCRIQFFVIEYIYFVFQLIYCLCTTHGAIHYTAFTDLSLTEHFGLYNTIHQLYWRLFYISEFKLLSYLLKWLNQIINLICITLPMSNVGNINNILSDLDIQLTTVANSLILTLAKSAWYMTSC